MSKSYDVDNLNQTRLGAILLRLTPVAATLGHKHVRSSIKDYVHAVELESEFVVDLFTLTTEEMAEKWYGGLSQAEGYVFES